MCCDIALAINVNFTANLHNWSRVYSPICLLLHLLHITIWPKPFLSYTTRGQAFALPRVCAHVQSLTGKDEGCTGCRRRWHVLTEEFGSPTTQFVPVKSLKCLFHRNNITLYKISRHFFFFICLLHVQMVTGNSLPPPNTLLHLHLTSSISSASIWMSFACELTASRPLKAATVWCRRAGPSWRQWGCGREPWTDCWGWGCRRAAWMSGSKGTGRGWRGSRSKGCNSWSSGGQYSHTGSWRKRPRRPRQLTRLKWHRPGCCRSRTRCVRGSRGSARCSGWGSAAPF